MYMHKFDSFKSSGIVSKQFSDVFFPGQSKCSLCYAVCHTVQRVKCTKLAASPLHRPISTKWCLEM